MSEIDEICARHERHDGWLRWAKTSQVEHSDRAWLLAEVKRLRVALEFYADSRMYKTSTVQMCGHLVGQPVVVDGGLQAREALEGGR